jgi:hypothetical protein
LVEKSQTRRSLLADLILVLVIAGLLVAILNVANEWKAPFRAETQIDLSFWKLPQYTLYSLARGWAAMLLSLFFCDSLRELGVLRPQGADRSPPCLGYSAEHPGARFHAGVGSGAGRVVSQE